MDDAVWVQKSERLFGGSGLNDRGCSELMILDELGGVS